MRPILRLRLARLLVRASSWWAPAHRRERFLREWEGELAAESHREGGGALVRAALGAFADARAMAALERRDGPRRTMLAWTAGGARDVRLAVRAIRRSPLFTAISVTTLAVGLGGAAALFTVVDRVVLAPLPYPESSRLVRLDNQVPGVGPDQVWNLSSAQFVTFTDRATTLDAVGVYRGLGGNLATPSGAERVNAVSVTASMMPLLGARAKIGRVLAPTDDTPTSPSVALLSRGFWERVLGADSAQIGRTLDLNGEPIEIVGVLDNDPLPPGWASSQAPDLWLPMRIDRAGPFWNNHVLPGIARLAPGATPEAVEAEIATLTAGLPEAFPQAYSQPFFDQYGFRTRVRPLKTDVLGDLPAKLWILFGGTGLVLLIACANVANLFLARMEGRRKEMGVRAALGAGRASLARYVLAESAVLSLMGAGAALLVNLWAVPALTSLAPAGPAGVIDVSPDVRTVLATTLASVVVGLGLAAYPILAFARARTNGGLVGGTRTASPGPGGGRLRSILVVSQVALALTLVVGSGLLIRTLENLASTDLGFEPEGVLAVGLYGSPARYTNAESAIAFQREVLSRVRALPGVVSAGIGHELPIQGGFSCTVQAFEDPTVHTRIEEMGLTTCAGQQMVTPGFFETLGIPVADGRGLIDPDYDPDARSVVVSRAFADRFWPGEDPIGKGVNPGGRSGPPFYHVVGVVGDVLASSGDGSRPLSRTAIAIYYPSPGGATLVVKAAIADPSSLFPSLRRVVSEVDPTATLANLTEMDAVVANATTELTFLSLLLGIAAGTSLLLAAVGLYGVISYVVSRRTREIGMRMAIGAQPAAVGRLVVGQTATLVAAGLLVGALLALISTRAMQGLLVGVSAMDPTTYAAAAGVLSGVALLASWLPARRASRIDPSEALRAE